MIGKSVEVVVGVAATFGMLAPVLVLVLLLPVWIIVVMFSPVPAYWRVM